MPLTVSKTQQFIAEETKSVPGKEKARLSAVPKFTLADLIDRRGFECDSIEIEIRNLNIYVTASSNGDNKEALTVVYSQEDKKGGSQTTCEDLSDYSPVNFVERAVTELLQLLTKPNFYLGELCVFVRPNVFGTTEKSFYSTFATKLAPLKQIKVHEIFSCYNPYIITQPIFASFLSAFEPKTLEHLTVELNNDWENVDLDLVKKTEQFEKCAHFYTKGKLEKGALAELKDKQFIEVCVQHDIDPQEMLEIVKHYIGSTWSKVSRISGHINMYKVREFFNSCALPKRKSNDRDAFIFEVPNSNRTVRVNLFDRLITIYISFF